MNAASQVLKRSRELENLFFVVVAVHSLCDGIKVRDLKALLCCMSALFEQLNIMWKFY